MTVVLQARFDEDRLRKISRIQAETGMSISELFRRLVDAAEVKPLEINVNLSTNAKSDAIRQDSTVAFAN
jgi:antitoxin component of RelBE/YafQ-DinJ toxin-antitoxin module